MRKKWSEMLNPILPLNFPQPNMPTVFPGRRAPQGNICNGLAFEAIINDRQDTRSAQSNSQYGNPYQADKILRFGLNDGPPDPGGRTPTTGAREPADAQPIHSPSSRTCKPSPLRLM